MVEVGPQPEEAFRRCGTLALQKRLGSGDLNFPRRPNGTALMLKQSLFERLLAGKTPLSSIPASDVSAAQGDLRHLSLEQLLTLLSTQGDAPTGPSSGSHGSFWNATETLLLERLAKRLQKSSEVAALVLLIYGVHERLTGQLPAAEHWLLEQDALLCLAECELRPLEDVAAYCHSNLLKGASAVAQQRRKLHWEVQVCEKPSEFKEKPRGSLRTRPKVSPVKPTVSSASGYPAPKAAVPSDEEATETETETEDEGPKPGSRPRVVAAGLCSEEQAKVSNSGVPKPHEDQELAKMQEEVKLARTSEASVQQDLRTVQEKLQASTEAQASMQADLSTMQDQLEAAKEAEAKSQEVLLQLKEQLSKVQKDVTSARDAEAFAQKELSQLREEFTSLEALMEASKEELSTIREERFKLTEEAKEAKDAEALAQEELLKLREELAQMRDAEAKLQAELAAVKETEGGAREELSKMQEECSSMIEEMKAAKDAEALTQAELSKLKEELLQAREAEAGTARTAKPEAEAEGKMRELKAAKDAEALKLQEELSKLREELTEKREAESKSFAAVIALQDELSKARSREEELREQLAEARTAEASDHKGVDLQWELMTAKDTEAQLREQLAEAKAAEARALSRAAGDFQEPVDSSPSLKAALEARADAAAAKEEDAESFASFESGDGGLVFRSPQKEV